MHAWRLGFLMTLFACIAACGSRHAEHVDCGSEWGPTVHGMRVRVRDTTWLTSDQDTLKLQFDLEVQNVSSREIRPMFHHPKGIAIGSGILAWTFSNGQWAPLQSTKSTHVQSPTKNPTIRPGESCPVVFVLECGKSGEFQGVKPYDVITIRLGVRDESGGIWVNSPDLSLIVP